MVHYSDVAFPAQGDTDYIDWLQALDAELRPRSITIKQIDNYPGATDDAKHVAAWNAARTAASSSVCIVLRYPPGDFGPLSTPIAGFNGMRAIGPDGAFGPKNQEISTSVVPHRVQVACGTGTSSLFVQSTELNEFYMGDISWDGTAGSQWWHNVNPNTDSLYPGEIHSCSWNGFNTVLGNVTNKFTITQFVFSGHCTILNFQNTPVHVGGSDNINMWGAGYLNLQSPVSVPGGGTKVMMLVDFLEKSAISNVYATNDAGWIGIRVSSQPIRAVRFYNCVAEGKAAGSPATAACVDVQSGHAIFFGLDLGQVTTANGAFTQSGGIVTTYSMHYRWATAVDATYPAFYQTGGIARHYEAVNGNGGSLRFRWSSAAASPTGVQIQDVAYPSTNKVV